MIINKEKLGGCKPVLLDALHDLEKVVGTIIINSGFRAGDPLVHGLGLAADIDCRQSVARYDIINWAIRYGIKRLGVYNLHIHIDFSKDAPQPVVWVDISR